MKTNINRGYFFALTSAVFLSTTAVFIRYLTQTFHIPPLMLAFWRDVFVVCTLAPVLGVGQPSLLKVDRKHIPYLIAYGFVLAVFNSLWTLSVAINGAAVATVMVYCSAGFTVVLGRWLLKESLNWAKITAVIISLAGCALVSGAFEPGAWTIQSSGILTGILTGVLAGLCYASYSLMGRSASQRGLNPWTTLVYTFGFATLFLLGVNLAGGGRLPGSVNPAGDFLWLGNAWGGWGILLLLAAVPTLAGFGLYNVSLSFLPSSVANLIATLEPVFTTVTARIFLGERLKTVQILGGLMILGSVILIRIYENGQSSKITRSGELHGVAK